MNIEPTGKILGATVTGIDLAKPLTDESFGRILAGIGHHGVLCFPGQVLSSADQIAFARRFGELEVHVSGAFQESGHPEMMILSNIVENGQPIGLADAGQDWHTDMSFSHMIAFTNCLYALKVPRRDGKALGNTQFASMTAAYDALPEPTTRRIEGRTATHDFEKFWEMMRTRKGGETSRLPLTDEQRHRKPPVSHLMVMTHPLSGRKVLYADPGYTVRVDGMDQAESDALLEELFAHQLRPEFRYEHSWTEGDVLLWDNLQTLHNAVADYGPDEHRLIKRCQSMANLVFRTEFRQLAAAQA